MLKEKKKKIKKKTEKVGKMERIECVFTLSLKKKRAAHRRKGLLYWNSVLK